MPFTTMPLAELAQARDTKTAKIEVLVTDQGNGASFCSACGTHLDGGDATRALPTTCPGCNARLTVQEEPFISAGGCDF